MIVFKGIPYPPSINRSYRTGIARGKLRRFTSRELFEFKQGFDEYHERHFNDFQKAEGICKSWLEQNFMIGYSILLLLPQNKVWTISKPIRLKKNDVDNRSKAVVDSLSNALKFDDKVFFEAASKKTVATVEEPAIEITLRSVRTEVYTVIIEDAVYFPEVI